MFDQAEALRALVRDRVLCCSSDSRRPRVHTIAVTSGKGGVGKTTVAVNLALMLARAGRQVRLVDADFGLSNADVLLGVSPRYTLGDVLSGRVDARDAWFDAPGGVKLLSSGTGLEDVANITGDVSAAIIDHAVCSSMDGDIIIVDTAPGINESVVSLLKQADEVLMVTSPEPTSITDSYAAMKVLFTHSPQSEVTLVVNECSNPAQAAAVARGLDEICHRFLGVSFSRHEYLPSDPAVALATRRQQPLAIDSSHSAFAQWLRKIAIKLDSRMSRITEDYEKYDVISPEIRPFELVEA